MKMRTMKPPIRMASGSVNHQDTERARYARTQRRGYGTSVFAICQALRATAGFWYLATIFFQASVPGWFSFSDGTELFVICNGLDFLRETKKWRTRSWKITVARRVYIP